MHIKNLNISYSTNGRWHFTEAGKEYQMKEPVMDIYINEASIIEEDQKTKGFFDDEANGRTLRIFKGQPAFHHHYDKENADKCDQAILIVLLTPGDECNTFSMELKKIIRPQTCDNYSCHPSLHSFHLYCSSEGALLALEAIAKISSVFGRQSNQWMDEAKKFIMQGPVAKKEEVKISLDPELESKIIANFETQQGALNLLQDLKEKPFNSGVKLILERLNRGVYGDFITGYPTPKEKLFEDLERYGLKDLASHVINSTRYVHLGPNLEKVVSDAVDYATNRSD